MTNNEHSTTSQVAITRDPPPSLEAQTALDDYLQESERRGLSVTKPMLRKKAAIVAAKTWMERSQYHTARNMVRGSPCAHADTSSSSESEGTTLSTEVTFPWFCTGESIACYSVSSLTIFQLPQARFRMRFLDPSNLMSVKSGSEISSLATIPDSHQENSKILLISFYNQAGQALPVISWTVRLTRLGPWWKRTIYSTTCPALRRKALNWMSTRL